MAGKGDADTRTPNFSKRNRNMELIKTPTDEIVQKVSDMIHARVPQHDIQGIVDAAEVMMPPEEPGPLCTDNRRTWAFTLLKALDKYEGNL